MKIDPHAALLAAQNLRTQDASARGRQASANFFAELQKANTGQQQQASVQANANTNANVSSDAKTNTLRGAEAPMREAPMRTMDPTRPMPPGSLLNILV